MTTKNTLDYKIATLAEIERGYSLSPLAFPEDERGVRSFVAGSEGMDKLLMFEAPEFKPSVLSDSPGGYVTHAPFVRDGKRWLVSAQEFYPFFKAEGSKLFLISLDEGELPQKHEIAAIPFVHRIAIFEANGGHYLIVSTLATAKSEPEDWEHPGALHIARIPDDLNAKWEFRVLRDGLTKNHGLDYGTLGADERPGYLVSAMEGLIFMPIPADPDGAWEEIIVSDEETSDAWSFDWDGDGKPEVFSISPFHGNVLAMHKEQDDGSWSKEVIHDNLAMGHVVWTGLVKGEPAMIVASRRQEKELRFYRGDGMGGIDPDYITLDEGSGASQMWVAKSDEDSTVLVLAAHGVNEIRFYELS